MSIFGNEISTNEIKPKYYIATIITDAYIGITDFRGIDSKECLIDIKNYLERNGFKIVKPILAKYIN